MKTVFYSTFLTLVFFLNTAYATHNRAGEILYKRIAPFTATINNVVVPVYTYSITVIKYMNSGGMTIADRCVDTVYFGDGSKAVFPRTNGVTGTCCTSSTCGEIIFSSSSYVVKKSVYSGIHTYAGSGTYIISSFDPSRNGGIVNIPNSSNQDFYIQSMMVIFSSLGENSSPELGNPPIQKSVLGTCFNENPGGFDADGDSLSYEITTCRAAGGQTVPGYFYPPAGSNGSFGINSLTGEISWCQPQMQGEYAIAFIIKEWRKVCHGSYQLIGYVLRDMQVLVETPPVVLTYTSTAPADTCVVAGTVINKKFMAAVSGGNFVVAAKVIGYAASAVYSPTAILTPTSATQTLNTVLSWSTNCSHVQNLAHQIIVQFGPNTLNNQFICRQFNVKVVPPAPLIHKLKKDTSKVTLFWKPICAGQVAGYNIYRKVGVNIWKHGPCETGAPSVSGFSLIGTALPFDTAYTDNNLWSIPNGSIGNYIVTTIMKDCNESFADSVKTTNLIVGLKTESTFHSVITVFPNPFNSSVMIDLHSLKLEKLETTIYSINGDRVYFQSTKDVSGSYFLEPGDLAAGIYLLELKSEKGKSTHRLVKTE